MRVDHDADQHLRSILDHRLQQEPGRVASGPSDALEHGRREPATNVTNDDPVVTGKIALAHLRELPDYRRSIKSSTVDSMRIRHLLSRPPAPEESAHEQPHCGR